ncbi:hypothetical protein T4D_12757 [Trichinella pseudospiralis]|uniref:Uncharacterized protein n=1 Tax=Trichinella pseudospiralis TaxID=6337 RepID=A0A0V1F4I2_TRIPS|nr:hypothetical protein T4D_12757 [Trichinella pseudospiralis]
MLNVNLLSGSVFSPMIGIRFAVTPLTNLLLIRNILNDVTRNILELGGNYYVTRNNRFTE